MSFYPRKPQLPAPVEINFKGAQEWIKRHAVDNIKVAEKMFSQRNARVDITISFETIEVNSEFELYLIATLFFKDLNNNELQSIQLDRKRISKEPLEDLRSVILSIEKEIVNALELKTKNQE